MPAKFDGVEKILRYGTSNDGVEIVLTAKGISRFLIYRDRDELRREHANSTPPASASTTAAVAAEAADTAAVAAQSAVEAAAAASAPVGNVPAPTGKLPPVTVPEGFLGEWNAKLEDCGGGGNDSRLRIGSGPIAFYESSGNIVIARQEGERRVIFVSRLQGEGTVFYRSTDLSLSEDGNTLTDNASGYVRYRCPAGSPSDEAVPAEVSN
jgi:hypothetical protein